MISTTNAIVTNGVYHFDSLPTASAIYCDKTIIVDGLKWECNLSTDNMYMWYAANTKDRLFRTYCVSATADDSVTAYLCYNDESGDYPLYIGGSGAMTVIPAPSTDVPPWGNDNGMDYRTYISRLIVTDRVTSLTQRSLKASKGLSNIHLTDDITTIGHTSFSSCTNLHKLKLPQQLTSIGTYAFASCTGLEGGLVIPNGVTMFEASIFSNCTSLSSAYIPSSVVSIPCCHAGTTAPNVVTAPFYGCSTSLVIYCGAASKPTGWHQYWNCVSSSSTFTVHWGITLEQYEASIA